ncbi:MAG: HAMP domain-containing histidine kinase [Bacteroidia bacterium]|nr:HAMP domain-containing histidine kinase [Bacteroidia bacterium]
MSRPLVIFYILVIYVLFQFGWWAYLLSDLYSDVFELRLKLIQYEITNPEIIQSEKDLFLSNLKKKWLMIAGEGLVFITLLFIGIRMINKAFVKEMRLTQQQKNFLLSVTHEFKSPLAAIRLNLQTLEKHELDSDKRKSILNNSLAETDRVTSLVNNALIASQMEARKYTFDMNWFNVSNKIASIIDKIPEAKKEFIEIHQNIEPDLEMFGDADAIESVINNLLQNAEKYSSNNKAEVHVDLKRNKKHIELIFKDKGIGIPGEERENVFTAFYRIGNEETRKTKGTGLGLYIAKYIIDNHKGKIEILDNQPVGTIFHISFPSN